MYPSTTAHRLPLRRDNCEPLIVDLALPIMLTRRTTMGYDRARSWLAEHGYQPAAQQPRSPN